MTALVDGSPEAPFMRSRSSLLSLRSLAAPLAFTLGVASLSLGGCIVGPTNAWDDDAPPELQVKGVLEGAAAFPSISGEAPRPPEGIKVLAIRSGGGDPLEVTTTAADGGAFRFQVPPGSWTLRAEHPSFTAASVGPLRVGAGDEVEVETLVLRLPVASASLAGRVVAQGGLSALGVEVSLLHDAGPLGCGAVEAKVTTAEDGSFLFDPVRPGRYVVVARTEGATLDVLAGGEAITLENDVDATLPRDLVIEPGTSVVELEADGVLPATTSRSRNIVVHTRALAGMTEVQLGGDPTFDPSLGGTGWRPFQAETALTLPPFEGEWTVFVQLRAGCLTSPLYAARVLYDPNPPEIVTAQAGTTPIDPLTLERPLAVVGAGQAGVATTFTVIDESGVAAVHFTLGEGGSITTQTVPIVPQPGQSVVRATADIPVEEGRYVLTIELEDAAGNTTPIDVSPVVDVLRDVSAPTTPVPAVPALEVAGETALLWLDQRDCPGGERAPVCEVNPHPDGLYRVRGGGLVEFASFAAPPFEVPLGDGERSRFEILAVDAAGYTSAGAAIVEVTRHVPQVTFTAPINKELGPHYMPLAYAYQLDFETTFVDRGPGEPVPFYDEPALAATNGTAFFSLRPRYGGIAPHFGYLIAQPADVPDVGTRWSLSSWPQGIRKLNHDCDDVFTCFDVYSRTAGALGAGAGALTWIERISIGTSPVRPFRYVLFSDADGRYDVRGPETLFGQPIFQDHEHDPAPRAFNFGRCRTVGRARCSEEPWAWAPLNQVPPSATAFDGQRLVTAGAASYSQRVTGADEGDVVITGPHVIAAVLQPQPGYAKRAPPLLTGVGLRMAAPAGAVLYAAFYEYYESGDYWDPYTSNEDFNAEAAAHVASGGGEELILAPDSTFAFEDPIAVGVYVPEGVTVTVPRVSVATAGFPYRPIGMIDRPASDDPTDALDAGGSFLDDASRSLDVTLFFTERDPSGLGNVAGLSLYDLGTDREPTRPVLPSSALDEEPEIVEAVADQRLGQLASTRTAPITVHTAAEPTTLEVPAELCATVIRPRFDVQLRAVTLEGRGRLDQYAVSLWERGGATPVGRYLAAQVNPNDRFSAYESFSSLDVGLSCSDDEGTLFATEDATGQVSIEAGSSDTIEVERATAPVLFSAEASGVLAESELRVLAFDPPNDDGVLVSEGQELRVQMTGTTGDADLYVRWDAPPDRVYYHCRPYQYGSDEVCNLVVPAGVSRAYIGVDGYYASNDFELTVEVTESSFRQVASYPVEAGDLFRAVLADTEGDPDLYLGFDEPPTTGRYDCRGAAVGDDVCDLLIGEAGTVYVAVLENDYPSRYELTSSVLKPTVAEIGTYAVEASDRVVVALTSTAPTVPQVRFNDVGAWQALECEGDPGALSCTAVVPAAATTATVGVLALEGTADFDATVDLYRIGCDLAAAGSLSGGNYTMSGVLRAGRHYVIAVGGRGFAPSHLEPDPELPPVARGAPSSNAYFDVLGAAEGARYAFDWATESDSVLVDGVDSGAPVCRLGFEITPSVQYTKPAIGPGVSAGVKRVQRADGAVESAVVAARLDRREVMQALPPSTVRELPARWHVPALAFFGEDLLWLEHDDEGRRARLLRAYAGVWPPGAPCEVHAFPADVRVASAALDDGRLLVGGRFAGIARTALYEVVDGGSCGSLIERTHANTSGLPVTAVLDGNDAFLWRDGDGRDGGALLYFSLRDLAPLYANDGETVLGFDARGGDVVFTAASALTGQGRTVLVTADASTGALAGARVLGEGVSHHPRIVGDALAFVRPSAPDAEGARFPEVVLRSLAAQAGDGVVVAPSQAYFAGAAPFDPQDVEAWSSEVMIDAGGRTLVVLGKDADGVRRLAIFRVPEEEAAFSGLVPEYELRLLPAGPSPDVERLSVSDDLVTLTFRSALPPVVLHRADTGDETWTGVPVGTLEQERVLGVWQGQLLLMKYPGDIYAERPPQHVELFLRDPVTGAPSPGEEVDSIGRLPSESYARTFAFVGPGVDGALSLYDDSASPPVLWRLASDGFAVRDDGSHRPLTKGLERGGPAGAPRSSGDALYFLRSQEGRVSLMRYRALD